MARTNSMHKPMTYAVSFGLAGGHWHARAFNRLMRQAHYQPIKQLRAADIIIAHSAGCWLIPPDCRPKLILYVGMPLSRAMPSRTLQKAKAAELRHGKIRGILYLQLHSIYYGVRQPRRNLRIMRMAKTAKPILLPNAVTVFLVNRHDPWPRDDDLQKFINEQPWAFISLPGTHDHIWQRPEDYVAIINHYARLLAQAKR